MTAIIDTLLRRCRISDVIKHTGVGDFQKHFDDRQYRGTHEVCGSTNNSSCVVDPIQNWWHCYVCGHGGDPIWWVIHAKFDGDVKRYREAAQYLADLYGMEIDDTPINGAAQEIYQFLTTLAFKWHDNLVQNPEALSWVMNKYGLSRNTVETLKLGLADELSKYSEDTNFLRNAGLLTDKNHAMLYGRIVFPFFKKGQVVWMSGRLPVDEVPEGQQKFTSLKKTSHVYPTVYNYDNAFHAPEDANILITEGLGDAAKAFNDGFRAIAPGGTQLFTSDMYADAVDIFTRCDTSKFIAYDSEVTKTGDKGARSLAAHLLRYGFDPIILTLPIPDGEKKVDVAEFLNTNGAGELLDLMGTALQEYKTLPNILIEELPVNAEANRIEDVLKTIAPLPEVLLAKYVDALAAKVKAKPTDLKKTIRLYKTKPVTLDRQLDASYHAIPFLAQDFVFDEVTDTWRAHTCLYAPFTERIIVGENEELVTTVHAVHLATDLAADGRYTIAINDVYPSVPEHLADKFPARVICNENYNRWSVDPARPYSYAAMAEGRAAPVDVVDLYDRIHSVFDRFVWLPDSRDKVILALYSMLTYIYMGFDAVPYLHMTGGKDTGKSTIMDMLAKLTFNTAPSSSISQAALFRTCDGTRPTFIIDEAEQLKNPPGGSPAYDLLSICLGGYTNAEAARVYRCTKDSHQPEGFNTYSPKVFGSINELQDTLASRSITVSCREAPVSELMKLEDYSIAGVYIANELNDIRDTLRVWALTQFRLVRDKFDNITRDGTDFLYKRDLQIWRPLLAIAQLIDEVGSRQLTAVLLESAEAKLTARKAVDNASEFSLQVLLTFWYLYSNHEGDTEPIGIKVVDDVSYLISAVAIEKTIEKMVEEKLWDPEYSKLTAKYFIRMLKQAGVVPETAKTRSLWCNTARRSRNAIEIDTKAFKVWATRREDLKTNYGNQSDQTH